MKAAFSVMPAFFSKEELQPISDLMAKRHAKGGGTFPGQTGIRLLGVKSEIKALLRLEDICSDILDQRMKLYFDRSSCRLQRPDGKGKLGLHQDEIALLAKEPNQPRMVAWVPLCDIDDETPTLEICPIRLDNFLPHRTDEFSYSVLKHDPKLPLVSLSKLILGDVVWMHSTTIHGSSIKPWHTKTRLSLDLRFLP